MYSEKYGTIGNYTVVIRSVDERTTALCYRELSKVFDPSNIVTIKETPFVAALKKTMQIGLDYHNDYLITMDADVIVQKTAIITLLDKLQETREEFYQVQGKIFDKFFYCSRGGGPRIIKRQYLEESLSNIGKVKGYGRPESKSVELMRDKGYKILDSDLVLGIHDFEQNYFDVFRKGYQHVNKHNRYLPYFNLLWSRLANSDKDYLVALEGLKLYKKNQQMRLDSVYFEKQFSEKFRELNIEEKSPILLSEFPDNFAESIIENSKSTIEHKLYRRIKDNYGEKRSMEDFCWRQLIKLYKAFYRLKN